jgi:hypothetical protein
VAADETEAAETCGEGLTPEYTRLPHTMGDLPGLVNSSLKITLAIDLSRCDTGHSIDDADIRRLLYAQRSSRRRL